MDSPPYHKLLSLYFLLSVLAIISKMKLMTELNRPIAVL